MIHTEQITKRPVTNVIESLSGQVAGLQMTMTNGQPGETPSILIRGISSMSAKTDPLIVLDGMPYEGGWNNICLLYTSLWKIKYQFGEAY